MSSHVNIVKRTDDIYYVSCIERDHSIGGDMTGFRAWQTKTGPKRTNVFYIHKCVISGINTFTIKYYTCPDTVLLASDLNKPYPITSNSEYINLTYEDVTKEIEKQIRIFNMVYNTYVKLYNIFMFNMELDNRKILKLHNDIIKRTTVDLEYPHRTVFNTDYDVTMSLFGTFDRLEYIKPIVDDMLTKYLSSPK